MCRNARIWTNQDGGVGVGRAETLFWQQERHQLIHLPFPFRRFEKKKTFARLYLTTAR
jgi:hypothetical protein